MDISEMVKELIQSVGMIKLPAAWMVATPSTDFLKTQMVNDVRFPFGRVRVLVKSVFGVSILITEAFGTKPRAKEVVAKMYNVTLQR
jgi:hypothetical protein